MVTPHNTENDQRSRAFIVMLTNTNKIEILAPIAISGYSEPVRGVENIVGTTQDSAERVASAVAHLVRFGQLLELCGDEHSLSPDSSITCEVQLTHIDGSPIVGAVSNGQKLRYKIKNASTTDIFFTCFGLSPGFGVKQLYPDKKEAQELRATKEDYFDFEQSVPDELEKVGTVHRDIIRTIVTTGQMQNFRGTELGNIWNNPTLDFTSPSGSRESKALPKVAPEYWRIFDREVNTSCSRLT